MSTATLFLERRYYECKLFDDVTNKSREMLGTVYAYTRCLTCVYTPSELWVGELNEDKQPWFLLSEELCSGTSQ